jgi:hypothetical protein
MMAMVGKSVASKTQAKELDPYLKKMAISTLLWVLALDWNIIFLIKRSIAKRIDVIFVLSCINKHPIS